MVRNMEAPINRLPVEILCKIFLSLQTDMAQFHHTFPPVEAPANTRNGPDKYMIIFTFTCRHWRNVALTDSRLWQYFNIRRSSWNSLKLFLDRSSPRMIQFYQTDPSTSEMSHGALAKFASFLRRHPERIGSLYKIERHPDAPGPLHALLMDTCLPSLSRLHLYSLPGFSLVASHLPALTHLSIVMPPRTLPVFPRLTHLCLNHSVNSFMDHDAFLNMLEQVPLLQKLILMSVLLLKTDIPHSNSTRRTIAMPNLVNLGVLKNSPLDPGEPLSGFSSQVMRLFYNLQLPEKAAMRWSTELSSGSLFHPNAFPPHQFIDKLNTVILAPQLQEFSNNHTYHIREETLTIGYFIEGQKRLARFEFNILVSNACRFVNILPRPRSNVDSLEILRLLPTIQRLVYTDDAIDCRDITEAVHRYEIMLYLKELTLWIRPYNPTSATDEILDKWDELPQQSASVQSLAAKSKPSLSLGRISIPQSDHIIDRWSDLPQEFRVQNRDLLKGIKRVATMKVDVSLVMRRQGGEGEVKLHLRSVPSTDWERFKERLCRGEIE